MYRDGTLIVLFPVLFECCEHPTLQRPSQEGSSSWKAVWPPVRARSAPVLAADVEAEVGAAITAPPANPMPAAGGPVRGRAQRRGRLSRAAAWTWQRPPPGRLARWRLSAPLPDGEIEAPGDLNQQLQ